ncbi:MAG TPA: glycosyltransferase [Thermoplasmata archaeon]|nr:glycosyltransferase [Thermoplasmata archaeon]
MEIAFFSDSYLPTRDGVAVEVHALAKALRRLGHAITVFTPQTAAGIASADAEVDGIPLVRSRALPVPIYGEYRWALFPFKQLRGREFGSTTDVVHIHTPGLVGTTGFFAARRYRLPLLGTFHTDVYAARGSFPGRALLRLFFRTARWYSLGLYYRCDLTTAPSAPAREALLEHASKPFRREIEVVPNGIETDRFRPGLAVPDWRTRCGMGAGPILTYLGRLTADKGVHRFLDSLHRLPTDRPWWGVVAGVGPEEPAVRARIRQDPHLAGRVRYLGPVSEEEKPALFSQSELFVLPSVADTASVAVLEAMASGVPCVVSNIGGPAALVHDGETGRVVAVNDPAPLTGALADLLDRPDERARLGRAAAQWVRREASIEHTARRFISLYDALLRAGADARQTRGT